MKKFSQHLAAQLLLSVSLFGFISLPAFSIELSAYVSDSIDAHPRVREKVHVYRQAVQDREAALSGWRPRVDLEGTVSHIESDTITNNSQSDDYNSNIVELAVTQNLFNGFDTENSIKQADARIQAALYDLYDTVDNVALEAVQAYIEVIKQHKLYKLSQKNVESHEDTLRQITTRSESGAGRRSELEQTEGRVARTFASMLAQYNNLEDALTQLHEILGRYLDLSEFSEPAMPEDITASLADLTHSALLNHPALKVAQFNIEAARHNHRRAKSSFYPKVDLRLAQEISDNIRDSRDNDDELSLSLTLSYNLYNGGADKAERQKRVSTIDEEQQFEGRVRRQIMNTLRLSQKADQLLQKQLVYLKRHVVKSQETMTSYREEFFVGERDLIDLLDAKNEVNSAQNSYTEAYYDALSARYRMHEGVGDLFKQIGIEVKVSNSNLEISRISAKGLDTLAAGLAMDFDQDQILDRLDQCDNSLKDSGVDKFGCTKVESPVIYKSNTPPKALDDTFDVPRNGVLIITPAMLLTNDSDAEQSELQLVNFSQPMYGSIAMSASNELIFRAADGFFGEDSFSYTVADKEGASDTGTVKIQIPQSISLTESQFVNFKSNSAEMTEPSIYMVDQILRALKEHPSLLLRVFTYTDDRGAERYNMALSERRAQAVIEKFLEEGVSRERFVVKAMGEQDPIADNTTSEGRAINRRGELIFSQQ